MVELPLFRSVLRRLLDTGRTAAAAELFRRLAACWADSPASPEAPEWADELVARADELGPGPRARLEIAAVHVQFAFELIADKLPVATRALARPRPRRRVHRGRGHRLQMAIGLGWRGVDMDRAAALLDRARTAFTDLGERHWAAVTLEFQGLLALRRLDVVAGIAVLEAAAAEHRAIGGPGPDRAHPDVHRLRPPGDRRPDGSAARLRRGPPAGVRHPRVDVAAGHGRRRPRRPGAG